MDALVCITLICISFTDLVFYNESRLNDENQRTGHLFFYLADEGNKALSLGRGVVNVHESSMLASGSREDVGNWQLHLKSEVRHSTGVAVSIGKVHKFFSQISMTMMYI